MFKQITITVSPEIAETISDFARKKDMPISAVYRRGAMELIDREGDMYDS